MSHPSIDPLDTKIIHSRGEPRWFDLQELAAQSGVQQIAFFSEIGSTNDEALQRGLETTQTPLLVLAEGQSGGRGRGSNRWWASEGALTFSLLVEPASFQITPNRWPLVSLATAVAVADLLDEFARGQVVGLKWPNDVHLGGRKICGILVETVRGRTDRLVIGIGLNVGNSLRDAPAEIQSIATSLLDETGTQFGLMEVLLRLLILLEERLRQLGRNELPLQERWSRQCVLTGHEVRLQAGDQVIQGHCSGLGEQGGLMIASSNGSREWFGGIVRIVDRT